MCRQHGFTLLEMLVVMVLMGLVTTLALPAMQRWHDAVQTKAQAAAIVDALRAASFKAGASRRDIVVDDLSFQPGTSALPADTGASAGQLAGQLAGPSAAETAALPKPAPAVRAGDSPVADESSNRLTLELPPRWRAEKVGEIRFLANGLCSPGAIQLRTERGEAVTVDVRGPLCGVELAPVNGTASR